MNTIAVQQWVSCAALLLCGRRSAKAALFLLCPDEKRRLDTSIACFGLITKVLVAPRFQRVYVPLVVIVLVVVTPAVLFQGYRITANEWDAFPRDHLDLPGAVFGTTFRYGARRSFYCRLYISLERVTLAIDVRRRGPVFSISVSRPVQHICSSFLLFVAFRG